MFHGCGFWSLGWLLLNILTWLLCLMGGWMLVRETHRQRRPPSMPRTGLQTEGPRGEP